MRTIRMKIIAGILTCSILTALLIGALSIWNSNQMANRDARERMSLSCELKADDLNATILRMEQSVNTLSDVVLQDFDAAKFRSDVNYADEYTEKIMSSVISFAEQTEGAVTAYVRYNPEYSNPTSGVFISRDSLEDNFSILTPTDFSMYDKDDAAHVGWYYQPIEKGAPMWMEPYLNANINVYMISYIVPIYDKSGNSIGIVGMDIDFSTITNVVDETKVYDTGYAFLTNASGSIMHHKELENGAALAEQDDSLDKVVSMLADDKRQGEVAGYSYQGTKMQCVYYNLGNGMKFLLTAPRTEIYTEAAKLTVMIGIAVLLSILICGIAGIFVGSSISKPIRLLTGVITQTAHLDFKPTAAGSRLRKQKDEIGVMSREIHQMRKILREMITQLNQTEGTILRNVNNLDSIMKENNIRAEDNSASTQEMAAGMEETSEHTQAIVQSISEVKRNSENIYQLAQDGENNSQEILKRAGQMERLSRESSDKTNSMYEVMREKTNLAIEQSKAVQRINELTEDIKEISSQTNLLALNANIEAARAGDAGRGFAVVATEIGGLATQTLNTVDNINTIVSEVNAAVSNMTECITTMMGFLENTVLGDYGMFRESGGQYRADADAFIGVMGQIKNAIEELDSYIENIAGTVEDINDTVSQSSEGISLIAEKSSETTATTMEGYEKLQESRKSVDILREIVEKFHT